jgi:hypothetical protein
MRRMWMINTSQDETLKQRKQSLEKLMIPFSREG